MLSIATGWTMNGQSSYLRSSVRLSVQLKLRSGGRNESERARLPFFDVMKAKIDAMVRYGNINFSVRTG